MAMRLQVTQALVSKELKRNGLKGLKKKRCHQITEAIQEKWSKRLWPSYMKLAAERWKQFITVDEALFNVENGVTNTHQYVKDLAELYVVQ